MVPLIEQFLINSPFTAAGRSLYDEVDEKVEVLSEVFLRETHFADNAMDIATIIIAIFNLARCKFSDCSFNSLESQYPLLVMASVLLDQVGVLI